ncbi:MAG: nuclear transport factor 2 family protein [Proteobacteria bacterium]|nr:nuclear transport factor 2 family protein [Pseudomonadota bacterium]
MTVEACLSPEAVAQAQLDAYNARDLDAFAACYAEDVEVYDFPNQPRYSGQAALREFYAKRFSVPTLKAVAKSRAVIGDRVVDHEECWLNGTDQPSVEVVVIYTVQAGLIRRVDFLR